MRKKMLRPFFTVTGLILAVAIAPEVVMADGGQATLVHACVSKAGPLRLIKANAHCKRRERSLHWPAISDVTVIHDEIYELNDAIYGLEARVGQLEDGQIEVGLTTEGVAGTYVFTGLEFGQAVSLPSNAPPNNALGKSKHGTFDGSMILNSDQTYSLSMERKYTTLGFQFFKSPGGSTTPNNIVTDAAPSVATASPPSAIITTGGTWSLSGNTLTIMPTSGSTLKFNHAGGGRLFINFSNGIVSDPNPEFSSDQFAIFLIRGN